MYKFVGVLDNPRNSGLETNSSQLVCRLVETPFWLVSRALSLAVLANENFKALKHQMETKLNYY